MIDGLEVKKLKDYTVAFTFEVKMYGARVKAYDWHDVASVLQTKLDEFFKIGDFPVEPYAINSMLAEGLDLKTPGRAEYEAKVKDIEAIEYSVPDRSGYVNRWRPYIYCSEKVLDKIQEWINQEDEETKQRIVEYWEECGCELERVIAK